MPLPFILKIDRSEKAKRALPSDLLEAGKQYKELCCLLDALTSRHEKAWSSLAHLTGYICACVQNLLADIEESVNRYFLRSVTIYVVSQMNHPLSLIKWPSKLQPSSISPEVMAQLKTVFTKVKALEETINSTPRVSEKNFPSQASPLLSFKALVKEIEVHFRYHFEGNRSTNNIEKVHEIN